MQIIFPENLKNGDTFELSNGEQFTVNGSVRVSGTNVNVEVVFDEDSIDIPIAEQVKLLDSSCERLKRLDVEYNTDKDSPLHHDNRCKFH